MKIAVIGTGTMGYHMAGSLAKKGYSLNAYNRTIDKAEGLKSLGVEVFGDVKDAVSGSDYILSILSDSDAIRSVFSNIKGEDLKDKTFIQMGTIASDESISFKQYFNSFGCKYIESPVLGSKKEAQEARLIIMVGADLESDFTEVKEILQTLGSKVIFVGDVGKAASMKLALNQLIAIFAVGYSASLGIIEKNNIDMDMFIDVIKGSALFAPMFEKKLPRWLKRYYSDPNFPIVHMLKDVNLIINELRNNDISSATVESIKKELEKAMDKGLVHADYSAVFNAVNNI